MVAAGSGPCPRRIGDSKKILSAVIKGGQVVIPSTDQASTANGRSLRR
jgi:hypothetical protein